jgi:hypothetical protein
VTRALTAVGIALVMLIGGLALAVYVTRDEDNLQVDNMLAENLTKAVALAEGLHQDVDLSTQARFEWDHVLLVTRTATRRQISRRLGYAWTGVVGFRTGELFLFMRGPRVVRFADYRGAARFAGFRLPFDDLPRARAVLRVRHLVVRPVRGARG